MIRICQNENCDKELKANQKRFCSVKCYQESRALKKVDDSARRVEFFENEYPDIIDVIPLSASHVEHHPKKITDYRDLPVKYFLVVAV